MGDFLSLTNYIFMYHNTMNWFVNIHGFHEPERKKDIFDRIFLWEVPGVIVLNSLRVGAIMTNKASQQGHLLLVPKRFVQSWDELTSAEVQAFSAAQALLISAQEQVYPWKLARELVSGFELPHYHKHLIPVTRGSQVTIQNLRNKPETPLLQRRIEWNKIKQAVLDITQKRPFYKSMLENFEIPIG